MNTPALAAQCVLVHSDDFFIGENLLNLGLHIAQIVAGDEWGGQDRPQAEVRAIFSFGHAAIADFEHVGIVPVSGPSERIEANLQIDNVGHTQFAATPVGPLLLALPLVRNVAGGAP